MNVLTGRFGGPPLAWLQSRPRVDLGDLPATIDLTPSRIAVAIGVAFGCVWLAFSMPLVTQTAGAGGLALVITLIFPAIGIVIAGGSLLQLFTHRRVTFDEGGVEVEGRSLRGRESWRLPYDDFAGVLHREHRIKRKHGSTTYQIIELHHRDRDKCIPLHVTRGTEIPRAAWEGYARALKLPALQDSGGRIVERAPEDLDASLKDLAARGRISIDFDPNEAPPSGLAVRQDKEDGADVLRVALTRGRLRLWMAALFAGVPTVLLVTGLAQPRAWPMALFGGGFLAVVGYLWWRDRRSLRELRITRDAVTLDDPWPWDRNAVDSLPLAEIESVRTRRARSNLGRELVIEGDRGYIVTGPGLSREALVWLERYVTAAVTTA